MSPVRRVRHTGLARGASRSDRLADLHNGKWQCEGQLALFGDTARQEQATTPGTPAGQQ